MDRNRHLVVASSFAAAGLAVAFALAPVAAQLTRGGAANAAEAAVEISPGLVLPPMNPTRGKQLYAAKGCVVCHAINGVGGTDAPDISVGTMAPAMNPFDFAAAMWNHSQGMIAVQMDELGGQIEFEDGQELADIVAFIHDGALQKAFTVDDVPPDIRQYLDSKDGMGSMTEDGATMSGN